MKNAAVLIMFLALLSAGCNDQHQTIKLPAGSYKPADTSGYTKVLWLDSLVNFGTITMGEKIEIRFRMKNTGTKPLYLSEVRPACGCTVADYTKEAIAPGKEGLITAAFDSNKSHVGDVRKTIAVNTNTLNGTEHTLIFTGAIKDAANKKP